MNKLYHYDNLYVIKKIGQPVYIFVSEFICRHFQTRPKFPGLIPFSEMVKPSAPFLKKSQFRDYELQAR